MRPVLSGFTLRDHGSIDPRDAERRRTRDPRDVVGGVHQSAQRDQLHVMAAPPAAGVLALKPATHAKSRLAVPDPLRRRLAWTMARDTLAALSEALPHVLVVSDQPALETQLRRVGLHVEVISESGHVGMNSALSWGAKALQAQGFTTIVACVGDLPALRPASVLQILDASRAHHRSFVADASGVGTTFLVTHNVELAPQFQGRSAAAHFASGAANLSTTAIGSPIADARRDVDTEADLAVAIGLGVGQATGALVDHGTGRLGHYKLITATQWRTAEGEQLAVTASGRRLALPTEALSHELRHARVGQRLHSVEAEGRVLSAWL